MTATQAALLEDATLSREARLMGLWLSEQGEGWHEVPRDDWRRFLGRGSTGLPGKESIARWLAELTTYDWVERRAGGRGHADSFQFNGTRYADANAGISVRGSRPLSPIGSPGRGRKSGSTTTTIDNDNNSDLDGGAEAVVSGELFKGCRDALRDYLRLRVMPDAHHGYAQRLAMVLNGTDPGWWKDGRGSTLEAEHWTATLAMALNELAAGDELGGHFRHKPGNIGNLRTTVRYLVSTRLGQERDEEEGPSDGGPGPGGRGPRGNPPKGGGEKSGARVPPGQGSFRRT